MMTLQRPLNRIATVTNVQLAKSVKMCNANWAKRHHHPTLALGPRAARTR